MTRKHFIELARNLRDARQCWAEHPVEDYPEHPDPRDPDGSICPEQDAWARCVRAVADAAVATNPRFDRGRFYRAAGADWLD